MLQASRSQVRIRTAPVKEPAVCRCGLRLAAGTHAVVLEDIPVSGRPIFENRTFCSVRCVRAFCLEALEALDALDTKESKALVSDIHEVYQALAEAFAKILLET